AAARAANSAVYLYAYQLDELERVAPFLELLQDLSSRLPEARIWAGFSRGIAALRAGDLTGAVEGFAASASEAERLGLYDPLSTARQGLAVTYAELGRDEDARRLGRRLLDDAVAVGLSCALRFAALNTAGWIQLDLAQRERQDTAPSELFDEALALVEAGGECPSWSSEVDIRVSLALTALTEDDPAMALAWLEPVDTVLPSLQPWVHEVRARAGLALGRPRLMPSIVVAPPSSLPRHLRYNALMAQAAAREHYGLHAAAIDAYAEAEQVVDEAVGTIGIDLGRELFLSGQQLSALRLVEALIVAGRQPEALCRARQARARALRLLDRTARLGSATPEARGHWDAEVSVVARLQRQLDADATQDWQYSIQDLERRGVERAARRQQARQRLDDAYRRLGGSVNASDCDDLPALRSGEAMIVVLPLRRRWAVFVATATDVHANLVEAPQDAATLGVWTREAFAGAQPLVEGAQRLRILPIGRSWELDVHALPWGDGVLLDLAPLEYALDLQRREAVGGSRRAVVVSDPARDLPLAREEADAVQGALTKRGWSVERLDGDDATYDRVMSTLSGATLLHYAGHGEHGGVTGWGARMRIGKGEGIGVTEILAMPEVPATVVLSGCETGRVASETLEGGMSLARAFVLAGSRWVIASDRTVPDPLAFALGLALYDDPGLAGADPAVALRNAQRQLRDRHPGWAAFRLVVP
ncbi:MAG: CHAT domain-containing protein, partial [Nannocystaceae bacterium]